MSECNGWQREKQPEAQRDRGMRRSGNGTLLLCKLATIKTLHVKFSVGLSPNFRRGNLAEVTTASAASLRYSEQRQAGLYRCGKSPLLLISAEAEARRCDVANRSGW